ncbi:MAG: peptide ABC transporter substrate-binding protein [Ruminococcaceae bacterium]|nr:peptide ABC transporter substrate-binding protein [Oscillospiraceae bacterium]
MKKMMSLLLALCMMLGLLAGCASKDDSAGPVAVNNINVAMGYQITTLDNAINTETGNDWILEHLYSGMFRKDENGVAQKELCDDFTISADGLVYTFTLKDGIVWSDGTPITAYDFEYSMLRALSYGVDNAYSINEIVSYLKGAKEYNLKAVDAGASFDCTKEDHSEVGYKALDEKTLEVTLNNPCAFLPELMTSRAWVPVVQSTPQHDSLWSFKAGYPTSGAYTLTEINETEKAVLTKNEKYWNKDSITMETITYWCMTDPDAQALAFDSKEIDVALGITANAADKFVGTDNLWTVQDGNVYFIAINSASTGPESLKDVNVRRALALAIDKQALSEVLGAAYYPMVNGYIPHGAGGVSGDFRDEGDADGYTLNYDLEKAKQLLADAGYNESNPLKLSYKYSNNSMHGDVATMLESFWTKLGVEIELISVEQGVYYDQIDQGDFELCRYADNIGSNAIRLLKFWSTENQVVAAISDPVYDKMCAEALQVADAAGFAQAMHGLEDYLIEENVYLIPLFEYINPYLIADGVEGETLCGFHPFFGNCTVTK